MDVSECPTVLSRSCEKTKEDQTERTHRASEDASSRAKTTGTDHGDGFGDRVEAGHQNSDVRSSSSSDWKSPSRADGLRDDFWRKRGSEGARRVNGRSFGLGHKES